MNESRTCDDADTGLTQPPSGFVLLDHMARDLYRAIPRMPKPARRFAYNLIEQIYSDMLFRPAMGDHPLQQPRRMFELQLGRLERALGNSQ